MTTISIRQVQKAGEWDFSDSSTYDGYVRDAWVVSSNTLPPPDIAINVSGEWALEGRIDREEELRRRVWAIPTIQAMANVLRMADNWTSGGKRIQMAAVVSMLTILAEILDDRTPPPGVVPTWSGGVQVEWHRNSVDFEIEADPQGGIEYFFKGPDEEREGWARDDLSQLAKYVQAVTVSE